jgi:hypothetical protein
MQLLEGIPFVWCDKSKPIQWWNTRLNIELPECLSEPLKGPSYGKISSPFVKFFVLWRKDIMCLDQFSESFFLLYWNNTSIRPDDLTFSLAITPRSLHHFEKMPLGSMGDPSGNYVVTLIIPSCILFKDHIPLFLFWGPSSCSSVTIVVSF